MFILIGDGANGKSTFVNVINKLLGVYSKAASSKTLVAKGSSSIGDDLVDLVSARLISVSETEAGEALAEAKIKQMTGGDVLKGRPLYGSWLEFSIIDRLGEQEIGLFASHRLDLGHPEFLENYVSIH